MKMEGFVNSKFNTFLRSIYILAWLLLEANRMLMEQIVLEMMLTETRLHEMIS